MKKLMTVAATVVLFSFVAHADYDVTFSHTGSYWSFESTPPDLDPGLAFGHGFLTPGSGNGARFDFWIAPDGIIDGPGSGGGAQESDPNFAVGGGNDFLLGSLIVNEDGTDQWQMGGGLDVDSFAFTGNLMQFTGLGVADGTAGVYGRVFQDDNPAAGDWYYVGALETLRDTGVLGTPPNAAAIGRAGGIAGLDQLDATPFSFQVVPEPGTWALFALGILTLAGANLKRKK